MILNDLAVAKDPTQTLQTFSLDDLAPYTREKSFDPNVSPDYRSFYVGPDDVHGVLKYLLCRVSSSLYFNMFGYDDDELDQIIRHLIVDDGVFVQGTLDKRQAGGVHTQKILAAWTPEMRASFAIGQSATHDISHTKGGVCDGKVAWEGSTNWSVSGEGVRDLSTGKARHAQNNTLLVHVNPVEVRDFIVELNEEHSVALHQQLA